MEYTIEQLKAHAYDVMAQIQQLQGELQATNEMIAKKSQEETPQEPKKKK